MEVRFTRYTYVVIIATHACIPLGPSWPVGPAGPAGPVGLAGPAGPAGPGAALSHPVVPPLHHLLFG